ncbi:putative methanogenesis marker 16 metalloprotein [Methanolobus vulcani]|uniref:Putative methanogenesis marker 16 metalloprotein n=1 Tax=Methanolobus vulcani TaxID=38026 RepID=A0A7Z7FDS6_9EURY|nr:methanogenesis marker 16 metalloprotein [Methanolobus vulcani]SDF52019.1 putative methanogenesis marker 16 metalloprotein [Methanolobus vulcani]
MERSVAEIREKLENKEAVVMTAQEISELVDKGEDVSSMDVDVVTTATRAIMSGTYAVLSFPVNSPVCFKRASKVLLNGVPAHVGPCPNESLGIVDAIVFGTAHSVLKHNYGAGHVFRELVEGKEVNVSVVTNEEETIESQVKLVDMPFAKLYATRHAFKNYAAFVNGSDKPVNTIFHATQFSPDMHGATLSGCGEINPVQNDPKMETIGIGTRVLMNGAEGFVIGEGTRSSPAKPNLTGVADMHKMDAALMGGFKTSAGPECIASWAIAIPVTSQSVLDAALQTDSDIPMVVNDVDKRVMIGSSTYADAWKNTDRAISFNPDACLDCEVCKPIRDCPMEAIQRKDNRILLNRYQCFNCGFCSTVCPGGVFTAELGTLHFEMEGKHQDVPIVLRQSDRKRAEEMAEKLKEKILSGEFKLNEMVERIYP